MLVSLYAAQVAVACWCCCSIPNILAQWTVWRILCACYNDVILDDALSSNLHNSICQVASKFKIVVGIRDLVASGTACPLPWFILVVFCHWWRRLPLHCWFVAVSAVACVLILWVWSWCRPPCVPWCTIPPVLLRWPMTWRFWLCVQCWVLPHCLVIWLCRWRERSVRQLCCKLWARLSNLHCCRLLIQCTLAW